MEQAFELTPAQKGIADLKYFYAGTSITTLCGAVLFDERFDGQVLQDAVSEVFSRHEALSLRFDSVNGKIMQSVADFEDEPVEHKVFSSDSEFRQFADSFSHLTFDIGADRMYRVATFEMEGKSGVILSADHLIADAWTFSLLVRECYFVCRSIENDFVQGRFTDHIARENDYLASPLCDVDRRFWHDRYANGFSKTSVGRPRSDNDCGAGRYKTDISLELSHNMRRYAAKKRISVAALVESAVLIYLQKISDSEDITIGVPVSGRSGISEKMTVGMFVSTLPLTVKVSEDESVQSLCKKTYDIHREIYRHRKLPFSEIAHEVASSGRLYDVLLSFQNSKTDSAAKTLWFSNGYSEVPLAIHIDDRDGQSTYKVTVDYQKKSFCGEAEVKLLIGRLIYILEQIASLKDLDVKDISILPDDELKQLTAFNDTDVPYASDKCVHEVFALGLQSRKDDVALVFHGENYTYGQLDKMSTSLALELRSRGTGRGDVVPIIARRDPHILVAVLAVMKAGAAYMLVSPDYPKSRIDYMFQSVEVKLALTLGYEEQLDVPSIKLDATELYSREGSIESVNTPDDLLYIVFTSGSTGKPKATAITHKNCMNYCAKADINVFGGIMSGEDVIVSVTNIVFDIFVTESILALLNGIRIVLADDDESVSGRGLAALIRSEGVNTIQTTPTKMRSFLLDKSMRDGLRSLKSIVLGGEALTSALLSELRSLTDAKIYNIYGPAETTVWSSMALVEDEITIGRPVANTKIHILDEDLRQVPIGIPGEICISGDGVGRGYINNAELTAERFIDGMYRTGDIGTLRPDGMIEFGGRSDGQIKLRGLRIETGEIECAMTEVTGVDLAAVVCRTDKNGNAYLASFYTSSALVDDSEIRRYLTEKLPSYMVPNRIVRIDEMPMTASGKIDRKSLPETEFAALNSGSYVAPETESEKILCDLMAQVLGLPQIGVEDDFFDIGGDSFAALQFVSACADKDIELAVSDLYECRTVRKLTGTESAPHEPSEIDRYPLPREAEDIKRFRRFARLMNKLYRVEVTGLDALDMSRRYIFCPSHESMLDPMFVWSVLSDKLNIEDTCTIAAAEFLDGGKPARNIFRMTGGIPLDRQGDFMPALNRAVEVLKTSKKYLLIHPEGTRSRTGELGEFKRGAALIAIKTGIPVIPVSIRGAGDIFPVGRRLPKLFKFSKLKRFGLKISFGTPIEPTGKSAEELTTAMRERMIELRK